MKKNYPPPYPTTNTQTNKTKHIGYCKMLVFVRNIYCIWTRILYFILDFVKQQIINQINKSNQQINVRYNPKYKCLFGNYNR